jgi:hypothetical protein
MRRRLQAHATPATRYCLTGAATIRAELKALGIRPLPSERTSERVLQRNGLTALRVRLASLLPRQDYPGPQARASNELHAVDLVGPIYLNGSGHRYYTRPGDLRRALARLQEAVNTQHIHPRLGVLERFAVAEENGSRRYAFPTLDPAAPLEPFVARLRESERGRLARAYLPLLLFGQAEPVDLTPARVRLLQALVRVSDRRAQPRGVA